MASRIISFYPGPSRVYDAVPTYVKDAYKLGILSINHRSEEFVQMSKRTISLLKEKLHVPKNYTIFFTSSATECWEIIAQSLITDSSLHFYNGAFGQKWYEYTKRINAGATPFVFDINEKPDVDNQASRLSNNTIICITQNETSNGTQISNQIIRRLRKIYPEQLIAVDATSSMAGVALDFRAADIWFASVQKCFGLPAGLGLMICSPRALQRASAIGERNHYNSLTFMMSMMEKWQTPFTPNVLGIYLLMRVLEAMEDISAIESRIKERYAKWAAFLSERKQIEHFITNSAVHSYTVLPVRTNPDLMVRIKKLAKEKGLLLGEGYGDFKPVTFRIANFPALKESEIRQLKTFLSGF